MLELGGGEGRVKERKKLEIFFNIAKMGKIDKPTTIVDRHGKILVWYLPDILHPGRTVSFVLTFLVFLDVFSPSLQARFNISLSSLKPVLADSPVQLQSWRFRNFLPPKGEAKFGVGVISIAPGKFMIGHQVSSIQTKFILKGKPFLLATTRSHFAVSFFEATRGSRMVAPIRANGAAC